MQLLNTFSDMVCGSGSPTAARILVPPLLTIDGLLYVRDVGRRQTH